jgi:hypothetical protein
VQTTRLPHVPARAAPRPTVVPVTRPVSAREALVRGFPLRDVVRPPGSSVRSSSLSTSGGRVQAAVAGSARGGQEKVTAWFRRSFASHGMTPASAPAVGGSRAVVFSDGANSATLTTRQAAGGFVHYSLFMALRVTR